MVAYVFTSLRKTGLKDLYNRGIANGVKELKILNREECLEIEPNLSDKVVAALYAPTSGIICPFMLNIAMAENANVNGVDFFFNTKVEKLTPDTCKKCGQRDLEDQDQQRRVQDPATLSTQQVSMQTTLPVWSPRRRSILHPDAATTVCSDKTVGNHVSPPFSRSPQSSARVCLLHPTIPGNLIRRPYRCGWCEQRKATTRQRQASLI